MQHKKPTGLTPKQNQMIQEAVALHQSGQLDAAEIQYKQLLNLLPSNTDLLTNLGTIALQKGLLEDAVRIIGKSLQINPNQPNALSNRGLALQDLKRLDEALASYDRAIVLNPDYTDTYYNRGNALFDLKRLDEALASYNRAIILKPNYADAYSNRGITLQELKRFDEALASYDRALVLKPDYAEAYLNRGNALKDLKRLDEALASYDRAIVLNPDYTDTYYNRGNALFDLKRLDEALVSYDRALALKPDYAEAYLNRGNALKDLKRLDEALASYDRAIVLKSDYAEAYSNRGNALKELKRLDEALASYDRAIVLNPDYTDTYYNRGNALFDLKRLDEALASYNRAIILKPNYADAYSNRGITLQELKRFDEALASYDRAIVLKPDDNFILGHLLYTKMHLGIWDDLAYRLNELTHKIYNHEKVAVPFPVLALIDDPEIQKKTAEIFVNEKCPASHVLPKIQRHLQHAKLRIGYFSADFRIHPMTHLTAELYETHDRNQFEIYAFYFGPDTKDIMNLRIKAGVDHFLDVRTLSDNDIIMLARNFEIDIAVDLSGYTAGSRTGIFAERSAPIQINYLGYPGTMGADYIDYLIADRTLIPEDKKLHYSEKIVYLPNSYMVNLSKITITETALRRQELGLPDAGFVFCCFNNNYKITPTTFASWMRMLTAVKGERAVVI